MADSSLDDFFAKKDKTKKKSKSKSQQLCDGDDVSKSDKKVKKKRDKDPNSTGGSQNSGGNPKKEDEEQWNDFQEEKEVDYTGLRIQNMQIAKEEQERQEREEAEEERYDEDGEVRERRDVMSGPWNKGGEPMPAPASAPEPVVKKEEPSAPKVAGGKYVPPSMRNQPAGSSSHGYPSHRRKKEAPNLQSEEDFPTLGGGPAPSKWYNSSAASDLIENPNQRRGGNLTLENKFSALQD